MYHLFLLQLSICASDHLTHWWSTPKRFDLVIRFFPTKHYNFPSLSVKMLRRVSLQTSSLLRYRSSNAKNLNEYFTKTGKRFKLGLTSILRCIEAFDWCRSRRSWMTLSCVLTVNLSYVIECGRFCSKVRQHTWNWTDTISDNNAALKSFCAVLFMLVSAEIIENTCAKEMLCLIKCDNLSASIGCCKSVRDTV